MLNQFKKNNKGKPGKIKIPTTITGEDLEKGRNQSKVTI
jgi:hypothetical protein